ncbi:hypothetical protein LY78DRAFT_186555 [Colletotrichum sublineola]|nr:hypothetical protein LY78DRAFT_186555 [Colletotrichum sublineola]
MTPSLTRLKPWNQAIYCWGKEQLTRGLRYLPGDDRHGQTPTEGVPRTWTKRGGGGENDEILGESSIFLEHARLDHPTPVAVRHTHLVCVYLPT